MGGTVTVVRDQQAEFQCVTTAWLPVPTVSWTLNGEAVNTSLYNTTNMADGNYYNSTSVLNFQAVSNTTVVCWATVLTLKEPKSSSAFLVVGKVTNMLKLKLTSVLLFAPKQKDTVRAL